MTRNEVCKKYNVPSDILSEYEKWNPRNVDTDEFEEWQYDDEDLELLSLIMTLYNIEFDSVEVRKYLNLYQNKDKSTAERLCMLNTKRQQLLDDIHNKEQKLGDIDYLRYELNIGEDN